MINVGRNNHAATCDLVAYQLSRQLFLVGDVGHLFGDHTLTGIAHLRKVAVAVFALACGNPLRPGLWDCVPISVIVAVVG